MQVKELIKYNPINKNGKEEYTSCGVMSDDDIKLVTKGYKKEIYLGLEMYTRKNSKYIYIVENNIH